MRRRLLGLLCLSLLLPMALACADTAVAPGRVGRTALPTDTETVGIVVGDIVLTGRLFGGAHRTVVILSHQRQNDQTAWFPFAQELATKGYAALTFNFRGYNGSGGNQDYDKLNEDLGAVIKYARDRGEQRIFLVGASMGATTSLIMGENNDVTAIVAVSPPAKFASQDALLAVPNVRAPKLFIASEEDAPALDFDNLYTAAAGPKEEKIYPGNAHGIDLLDPSKNPQATSVEDEVLSFLRAHGGP